MNFKSIVQDLLPATESDPKFRDHLSRLSCNGLKTLAVAEIAVPLFLLGGHMALTPGRALETGRLLQAAAMIAVGALTLALSRTRWSTPRARLVALVSAWTAPSALRAVSLWKPPAFLSR